MTVSEKNTCPAQYGITGPSLGRYEGWSKLFAALRTPGAGLSRTTNRKASSEDVYKRQVLEGFVFSDNFVESVSGHLDPGIALKLMGASARFLRAEA